MDNKNSALINFNNKIAQWVDDVKNHEITDMVEVVEQAKKLLIAAETLPEDKIKQFIDNFKYDLNDFYQQNRAEAKHSVYLALLNERWWSTLAQLTDKSQVEWAELTDDFEHDGIYHSGDIIGFGELECQQCHHSITISHLSQVIDCIHCGGNRFIRHALTP